MSMIMKHPLWREVKLTKKDKEDYKKRTGLELKRMVVPKDKYYKLLESLYE